MPDFYSKEELFAFALRIAKKRLRTCHTLHFCQLCKRNITDGQQYYDGNWYGARAHKDCADNPVVAKEPTQYICTKCGDSSQPVARTAYGNKMANWFQCRNCGGSCEELAAKEPKATWQPDGLLTGYEWRINPEGHRETRPIAKEPICNCGPNPDTHEDLCAAKEPK